nr:uncharacterized protein LOC117692656 isoform X2 [Crassostrea gigas]
MDIWLKICLTFVVSHKVKMKRLVVNTTCVELAKPSNQQYRLTCRQLDYHCLLDDTYTQEFEVCREWKWIPEGNCAYFNSYGEGNIDGRLCISSPNLFCPNARYSSAESTKYSTCYVKQNTHTISPTTSSFQVGSDRSRSTSFLFSVTTDKTSDRTWMGMRVCIHVYIAIAFGVLIPSLSVVVLCFRYRKATDGKKYKNPSAEKSDDRIAEQELLIHVGNNKPEDRPNMINGSKVYLTVGENEDGNNKKKDSADTSNMPLESKKINNGDVAKDELITFDEKEDDKESTDVFDDTIESLQRIAPPTDEQDTELCTKLFNLLAVEGLNLSQEIMGAIITSETRKSVKELVADKNVLENLISDEVLPKECYWSIENVNCENSSIIHILHSLLRIHLNANDHPKSGWGNPVRETDFGIGDDIERLNRIYIIFRGISNPVTVSVESYIRLLDIMIEALPRLDPDAEFKEDFQIIVRKLTSIEIPTLTQTVVNTVKKKVLGFVNRLS